MDGGGGRDDPRRGAAVGFKWQDIARILPGRSANAVRNRFLRFPAETRRAADSAAAAWSWPNTAIRCPPQSPTQSLR